ILMANDAGLPLGQLHDGRSPEQLVEALTAVTRSLAPYRSFRGWSWASQWWIYPGDKPTADHARTPAEKTRYEAALKKARDTGAWDPVLDQVFDQVLALPVDAQDRFNRALKKLAPDLVTAVGAPYRNPNAYPPVTFRNVDEMDLQAQWEQV